MTNEKSAPSVLILGSSSDMGRAIARAFAAQGSEIILAARKLDEASADARDIAIRFQVPTKPIAFDVVMDDPSNLFSALGAVPDIVVSVVGFMGDQRQSEQDVRALTLVVESNYTGPARFLSIAAEAMAARRSGTIVGISSVAGERGRVSNYIYGSAKAGFTAFLSGLRNRMTRSDVHVLTVKPGFVYTRMTSSMKLPPALTAQPEEVGAAVVKAVAKKRNVIYVRPIWAIIMLVIRSIPEAIFKRLSL